MNFIQILIGAGLIVLTSCNHDTTELSDSASKTKHPSFAVVALLCKSLVKKRRSRARKFDFYKLFRFSFVYVFTDYKAAQT